MTEAACRSNGNFSDWDLVPVPDPEGTGRSLALPSERAALAALRREEAYIQTAGAADLAAQAGRPRPPPAKNGGAGGGDGGAPGGAAEKPTRKPKGQGKGDAAAKAGAPAP